MRDTLQTERLVLRQTELRDAAAFSALVSDFDIARMTGSIAYPYPVLSAEFKIMSFLAVQAQRVSASLRHHPARRWTNLIGVTQTSSNAAKAPFGRSDIGSGGPFGATAI